MLKQLPWNKICLLYLIMKHNLMRLKIVSLLVIFFLFTPKMDSQNLVHYKNGNLWGFADVNGQLIIPAEFIYVSPWKSGRAYVHKMDNGKKLNGIISNSGKFLIKPLYESIGFVYKERFPVKTTSGKWGLINIDPASSNSSMIIEPNFLKISFYKEKNQVYCFYDKTNIHVYDLNGTFIEKRTEGNGGPKFGDQISDTVVEMPEKIASQKTEDKPKLKIYKANSGQGAILYDAKKNDTLPPVYKQTLLTFTDDQQIIAYEEDKVGILNIKGEVLLPIEYQYIEGWHIVTRDAAINENKILQQIIVSKNLKYGVIGSTSAWGTVGAEFIELVAMEYDKIEMTESKKFYVVKKDLKKGIIMADDLRIISEPRFYEVYGHDYEVDGHVLIPIKMDSYKDPVLWYGSNGVEFWK